MITVYMKGVEGCIAGCEPGVGQKVARGNSWCLTIHSGEESKNDGPCMALGYAAFRMAAARHLPDLRAACGMFRRIHAKT
jgi:hypothetical protein